MALTPRIANVCGRLGTQPELFQETDAFQKAIIDLLKASLVATGDLAHFRTLAQAIDDSILFEQAIRGLKNPDIRKLLKVIDQHWVLPKEPGTTALFDRLIQLASGQVEAALDQTQYDRELKRRSQMLAKAKDITAARAVLANDTADAVTLITKLSETQQRALLKRLDKHNEQLVSASATHIAEHLESLLTSRVESVTPPEKPKKSVGKSGKKPTRTDPMKTTVMSAKWDGIDRD
jgi:hypothetical protein